MSRFGYGFLGFLGHLTVLSIPFMIATTSTGSTLRIFFGIRIQLVGGVEWSFDLVDGLFSGRRLSHTGPFLGTVDQGLEE